MIMQCPLCGSLELRRDYAPARSYALILLGLALLAAGRFLKPEMVAYPLELHKLVIVGVAILLFGLFDIVRHGNRYCAECGYCLRVRAAHPGGGFMPRIGFPFVAGDQGAGNRNLNERPGARFIRGSRVAASSADAGDDDNDDDEEINPNTPLEPIMACLKFKDPKMRKDALKTLRKLTGQDFGEDHDAWRRWYDENKDTYRKGK